ncbi:MAG: hypothetical protein KGJ86_03205 [Chloroflexota bacterium]|nr:hypothetical protein [Chloroflexota bacterium]
MSPRIAQRFDGAVLGPVDQDGQVIGRDPARVTVRPDLFPFHQVGGVRLARP